MPMISFNVVPFTTQVDWVWSPEIKYRSKHSALSPMIKQQCSSCWGCNHAMCSDCSMIVEHPVLVFSPVNLCKLLKDAGYPADAAADIAYSDDDTSGIYYFCEPCMKDLAKGNPKVYRKCTQIPADKKEFFNEQKYLCKDKVSMRKALQQAFSSEDPRILEQQLALFWMRKDK